MELEGDTVHFVRVVLGTNRPKNLVPTYLLSNSRWTKKIRRYDKAAGGKKSGRGAQIKLKAKERKSSLNNWGLPEL